MFALNFVFIPIIEYSEKDILVLIKFYIIIELFSFFIYDKLKFV